MYIGQITKENCNNYAAILPKDPGLYLSNPDYFCYAIYEGNALTPVKPVGTVAVLLQEDKVYCCAILKWIYVHPKYRGQGIGNRLIDELLNKLFSSGVRYLIASLPTGVDDRGIKSLLISHDAESYEDIELAYGMEGMELSDADIKNPEGITEVERFIIDLAPEDSYIRDDLPTTDIEMIDADADLPEILPRFYGLINIAEELWSDIETITDEAGFPEFIIKEKDGISVRVFISLDDEEPESFFICFSYIFSAGSEEDGKRLKAAAETYNIELGGSNMAFYNSATIEVNLLSFLPCEDGLPESMLVKEAHDRFLSDIDRFLCKL